jgi:hypothetical protein
MKKIFLSVIVILFFQTALFSQGSITGKIVDSIQVPVPFAIIALENSIDSSLVKGTITDENGLYVFNSISAGNYLLKISATGFEEKYSSEIKFDSIHDNNVQDISLHSSVVLKTATITSAKSTIEFTNGNITVNVENSALAKGNSVYDLLYKLPGVTIDDNQITLMGKTGVVVMIDGRVQQLSNTQLINLLKSMSAESVQKIEILKNPPPKYDASGTSGMINIVTKKAEQRGFSGSTYIDESQGNYNNSAAGVSLNYKNDKVSIFSGVDGEFGKYHADETFDRKFPLDSGTTEFSGTNQRTEFEKDLDYKIGADWTINKKNTAGIKFDGESGYDLSTGTGTNNVSNYNNLGFDHLGSSIYIPDNWTILDYNVNAEHRFDTSGTVLNFSTDYTDLKELFISYSENHFYDPNYSEILPANNYRNTNHAASQLFASKLDLTKYINKTSTFESGIKLSSVNAGNDFSFEKQDSAGNFLLDQSLSNNYNYNEQTLAAYINYNKNFKKSNLQIGLRGEKTNLVGENKSNGFQFTKNYFSLFPTVSFEYTPSDDHDFQLNYSRRIDRPDVEDLNPSKYYRDQYSYYEGNPFLLPDYDNKIEFSHVFREVLSNSISYDHLNNIMLGYTLQNDTSKVFIESVKNMKYRDAFSYMFFFENSITGWMDLSLNGVLTYFKSVGDLGGVPYTTTSLTYYGFLTTTILLPQEINLEITGFYRGPKLNGVVAVKPMASVSFAIKKSFFKEKLDCTIGAEDIFHTMKIHTSTNFSNQNWTYYNVNDSRRLVLSINYNFGRVKAQERDVNTDKDEKERLNH